MHAKISTSDVSFGQLFCWRKTVLKGYTGKIFISSIWIFLSIFYKCLRNEYTKQSQEQNFSPYKEYNGGFPTWPTWARLEHLDLTVVVIGNYENVKVPDKWMTKTYFNLTISTISVIVIARVFFSSYMTCFKTTQWLRRRLNFVQHIKI